jgi:hypothetical protein
MSLLYTSYNGEDSYNLYCPNCQQIVMVGNQREMGELACAGVLPLCFNCHPGPADKIYPGLMDDKRQCYLVVIDGVPFMFEWVWSGDDYGYTLMANKISWSTWYSLKTGDVLVTPLSSSTNVHNLCEVIGEDLTNV